MSAADFGFSKVAVDKVTFAKDTMIHEQSVNHSLGQIPAVYLIIGPKNQSGDGAKLSRLCGITTGDDATAYIDYVYANAYGNEVTINVVNNELNKGNANDIYITLYAQNRQNVFFKAGAEYKIITFAK